MGIFSLRRQERGKGLLKWNFAFLTLGQFFPADISAGSHLLAAFHAISLLGG